MEYGEELSKGLTIIRMINVKDEKVFGQCQLPQK